MPGTPLQQPTSRVPSLSPFRHSHPICRAQILQTRFCGTAATFSKSIPNLLAVGTGQNFGIAGRGCQHVFTISPSTESPVLRASYLCEQTVLDCAWSEASPSVLGASLGNGTVNLWDIRNNKTTSDSNSQILHHQPFLILKGHKRECFSLEWNMQLTNLLLTASWDLTIRLWDVPSGREILCLPGVHYQAVYKATWCPSQPTILATCGSDGYIRIIDTRENHKTVSSSQSLFISKSVGTIFCHEGEVLSIDWNKFSPFVIATSGTDNIIRIWDIRKIPQQQAHSAIHSCISTLSGHSLAVRCIQWSPFRETILSSGSYDMSVSIWDCREGNNTVPQFQYSHHSEFVIDVDWSLFLDGVFVSASWDGTVGLWDALSGIGPMKRQERLS